MALSERKCRTAKEGKYEDGDGLRLVVTAKESKRWVLRFTFERKRREMGLGPYPVVSLADARELARQARAQVVKGIDPIEARGEAPKALPTFTRCAAGYIKAHRRGWKNRKHARQWCATLKTYARGVLGNKPVDTLTTEDVLAVLKPIWLNKTETAKRVQGRIENILDYAAAHGFRDPVNPARWKGHLDKLLPGRKETQPVEHHPAMPFEELPDFFQALEGQDDVSSKALRFLILTACRTGEVLGATWAEIDLERALWTIPAYRMKAKKEHQVPLSEASLTILGSLPRIAGESWVFPGGKAGRPLSSMALLMKMRGLGYGQGGSKGAYVPHGFRSTFRDWAAETTPYPREVCEMALAHGIENKVEAAYRRGNLLDKRRAMMSDWAKFLLPVKADVIPIGRRRVSV